MPSPVQPGRDRPWLILVGAGAAALLVWSMQQRNPLVPSESVVKEQPRVSERASANLPALFSSDDYPQAALLRGEQGTVAFKLKVNPKGRVERCDIEKSSGYGNLDQATCRILQRRARFAPARGPDGRPVADATTGRIRWELPN